MKKFFRNFMVFCRRIAFFYLFILLPPLYFVVDALFFVTALFFVAAYFLVAAQVAKGI